MRVFWLLLVLIPVLACGPSQILLPTPTAPFAATQQPTSTTLPLTPTSIAPIGDPTEHPLAGAQTYPLGPWVLWVESTGSAWRTYADGSEPVRLVEQFSSTTDYSGLLPVGYAPNSQLLAIYSGRPFENGDLSLSIFELTSPQMPLVVFDLFTGLPLFDTVEFGDPAFEAIRAIAEFTSFEWSPDGQTLAFMGAMDGPSSDLYTYTPATKTLLRLSDGSAHGAWPHWSPDGRYIWHIAVESFGTGAGFTITGVYSARTDDSGVINLSGPSSGGQDFFAWLSPNTVAWSSWRADCGSLNLRAVNVETLGETVLWAEYFTVAQYDASTQMAQISVDVYVAECNSAAAPAGEYVVDARTGEILSGP